MNRISTAEKTFYARVYPILLRHVLKTDASGDDTLCIAEASRLADIAVDEYRERFPQETSGPKSAREIIENMREQTSTVMKHYQELLERMGAK